MSRFYHAMAYLLLLLPLALAAEPEQALRGVWDGKTHVVYHVSDRDNVKFVLNNIRNHIKGGGGSDKLDIVLLVHGSAGKILNKKADKKIQLWVSELHKQGVEFDMCGNTMDALGLSDADLLPGFIRHDEGGVVRLTELQSKGYLYIRP
jgi:hypothetical protein